MWVFQPRTVHRETNSGKPTLESHRSKLGLRSTSSNAMNQPRNPEHTINSESQWLKMAKKLDSKLQKQRQGWPKVLNTARKYNKDEFLQNYDSEVQMYARAHSEPQLANYNHLKLRARTKTRTKARGVSSEFVKFKTAIVLLFKPFVWWRSRCLKDVNIDCISSFSFWGIRHYPL